jgi:uncharacterized membrane protein YwzB
MHRMVIARRRTRSAATRGTAPLRRHTAAQRDTNPYRAPTVSRGRRGATSQGGTAALFGWLSIGAFVIYVLTIAVMVGVLARGNFEAFAHHAGAFMIGVLMIFVGLALGIVGSLMRGPKTLAITGLVLNGLPFIFSLLRMLGHAN